MDEIRVCDSESPLSTLLDAVEAGRDVVITRDGRPVARVVPSKTSDTARMAVDALHALRAGIAARGEAFDVADLKGFRDAGRR